MENTNRLIKDGWDFKVNIQTYLDFLTLGFVANKNIIIILLFSHFYVLWMLLLTVMDF